MGAYNVLYAEVLCPHCGEAVELKIQFKYGDTWQHEYRIGDRLKWGGNDHGVPGAKKVVLDGTSEECPKCGCEGDFCILVEEDKIASATPGSGDYDFSNSDGYFLVLDG